MTRLHRRIDMRDEERILIEHCCSLSVRSHSSSSPFLLHSLIHSSPTSVFVFPGSWFASDWIDGARAHFGDCEVDSSLFPSLRSVGSGVVARVNGSFLCSFQRLLAGSSFRSEVHRAIAEKKHVVFTGHSSGGAMAVLAAVWLLENCIQLGSNNQIYPFCVTFGSPLVGDTVFRHALEREDWSRCFLHFVMMRDIVPRILLTPLSSLKEEIQAILHFLCPKTSDFSLESIRRSQLVTIFYGTVLRSALSISSYQACLLMGCTSTILGTLTSFIELSPYRPVGNYAFCSSKGQLITVENSDAVLQLLFYCLQLGPQQQLSEVAYGSLNEHWQYETKLKQCLVQNAVCLDLEALSLSSNCGTGTLDGEMLGDLELDKEARLSLCAAGEWEKQRQSNQAKIDANYSKIQEELRFLDDYRETCKIRGLSYYDSFKLQRNVDDFNANVKRLELAGLWDEIVEMLRRRELPDGFEGRTEWVNLGTSYRRLVEPLDIANYYRHSKNEDTGPYMSKGRPRRYKYTQKWHEQAQRMGAGTSSESCFWAIVEELQVEVSNCESFDDLRESLVKLENQALQWFNSGCLGMDSFLGNSSFVMWWKTLPEQHRSQSCIAGLVDGQDNL
ncbi:protein EDS1L-like [Typha angustifolia]|uniref:protein EDS1L-like n=1 Tax=Typha angustifolia TaxID=59011 RepID=UPI003C2E3447